jgi:hypothetical protein
MIAFLLDVYVLAVWLIFVRFKLLKFDLKAKISVGVIGVLFVFGQGQMTPTGVLPFADKAEPRGRFAVKIVLDPEVRERYRPPVGAGGAAAIYTDHVPSFRIVRKIVIRWYTWLNFVKISM